jgi:enoyl-CoA hydratase/carnithine racemase
MGMPQVALDYSFAEGLLLLTLDRPDKLNAFTAAMADELIDAFQRASEDDSVRAVIVTGSGRSFCAGMDLSAGGNVFGLDESLRPDLQDLYVKRAEPRGLHGVSDAGGRVTLAIFNCKKPVIAAINGAAVGIGVTMTLAMDFRLASSDARFGFVFGRLGIVPEACSTWFLPRIVGLEQALEWAYRADIFDAAAALRGRLIRSIHAPETLLDDAARFAQELVKGKSPVAVALTRQMLYRNSAERRPLDAHLVESLSMFYTSLADGKEGVAAFLEKRAAQFSGHASDMPGFHAKWIDDNMGG